MDPGVTVWFQGGREGMGLYGGMVNDSSRIEMCLPRDRYVAFPPDGHAMPKTYFELPLPGGMDVFLYPSEVVRAVAPTAGTQVPVDQIVGSLPRDVRAIGLGESTHGSAEFFETRTDISLELASVRGARAILIEAGAAEVHPLDEFVRGRRADVEEAVAKLGYWTWDTKDFIEALKRIRSTTLVCNPIGASGSTASTSSTA